MTRIETAEKIANAIKILKKEIGNTTFTANDYKQFKENMPCLQTLKNKHIVKIDHYETFVKTVPNDSHETYIYNNKNQRVMKWIEYRCLPSVARKTLIELNDGQDFEIKCPEEITFSCKCYYYVVDYNAMTESFQRIEKSLFAKKEKKEQELIEINNKIRKLEEINNNIKKLEEIFD